ncbi:MAG: hypothetical protein D6816_08870 [Bacteroidetes bacterium]|nr:MAG: hypothetical protein D6816_08870 [Bacteroidota bacterium]
MKFTWGTGIAIFYIAFVIIMVGMVVYSKTFDNSLVVENYYDEDLRFQEKIDKLENSAKLEKDLEIASTNNLDILLSFPENLKNITGTVLLYRADDISKDVSFKISVNEKNQMLIPGNEYLGARWTVKVDWQGDGTPYYKEKDVLLAK